MREKFSGRTKKKLIFSPGLLFDMSVDPCETNNVADDYQGIIKDMEEKLKVIKSQN